MPARRAFASVASAEPDLDPDDIEWCRQHSEDDADSDGDPDAKPGDG